MTDKIIEEKKDYMDRIGRLKERLLNTRPEMDLENAVILTKGFQESEGQPLACLLYTSRCV